MKTDSKSDAVTGAMEATTQALWGTVVTGVGMTVSQALKTYFELVEKEEIKGAGEDQASRWRMGVRS